MDNIIHLKRHLERLFKQQYFNDWKNAGMISSLEIQFEAMQEEMIYGKTYNIFNFKVSKYKGAEDEGDVFTINGICKGKVVFHKTHNLFNTFKNMSDNIFNPSGYVIKMKDFE